MYKKQMKFQKLICFLQLIAGAIVFIYSLGIMTDLYESLYKMIPDPDEPSLSYVDGATIYYDMQDFNKQLTVVGLVLILLAVFMLIMNTHTRRKYYVGNFVAIGLNVIAAIGSSVWGISNIMAYKNQYLTTVDFEKLLKFSEMLKSTYTDSTRWFDACFIVFGILLCSTVLLVFNMIWKMNLTKGEQKLINEGKEVA